MKKFKQHNITRLILGFQKGLLKDLLGNARKMEYVRNF